MRRRAAVSPGAARARATDGEAAQPGAYEVAAADGRPIAAYVWPSDAKAQPVLGVHGLGDHGRALPYRLLAAVLADAGYGLVTYDQRGHGDVAPSARGRATWNDLRRDLRVMHVSLGAPPIVGISMGALLALDHVLAGGDAACPVVAAAAPLGAVRAAPLATLAARHLGAWFPGLNIGVRFDPQWIAADAEAVRLYTGDPLFHRDLGARLAAELLGAIERVHTAAGRLANPLLLLHGTDDRIAPWDAGFARRAPRGRCTVRLFEGGRHNLFIDSCRAQVFAAVIAHLRRPTYGPAAAGLRWSAAGD